MLSEVLWGLAAAGGTAIVGTMASDIWRSARLRLANLLRRGEPARERAESGPLGHATADIAGPRPTQREGGHPPGSRWTCVQHNIASDGGTQHITLSGDINVDSEHGVPR